MGCNTSKESVQPVEGEDKTEEKTEDKMEGDTATTATPEEGKPDEKDLGQDIKDATPLPTSATTLKALTPTSDSARSGERLSNHLAATTPEPPPCDDEPQDTAETEDEAAAATKIQAAFRGHHTRRTMKQAHGNQHQQQQTQQGQLEAEPTREQLEAEFRADDKELCKAATTIQNSFRSHLKTKQDGEGSAVVKEGIAVGKEENKDEEELDIDLTDPDLNKAATKIQASFRGHKVRKETEGEPANH